MNSSEGERENKIIVKKMMVFMRKISLLIVKTEVTSLQNHF